MHDMTRECTQIKWDECNVGTNLEVELGSGFGCGGARDDANGFFEITSPDDLSIDESKMPSPRILLRSRGTAIQIGPCDG